MGTIPLGTGPQRFRIERRIVTPDAPGQEREERKK